MSHIRIAVTADICPIAPLEGRLLNGTPEDYVRPALDLFRTADIVIGNLETPLCDREEPIRKSGPNFRVTPLMAGVLRRLGFDILTLCNNHIKDQGVQGLEQTLNTLDSAGILHCGAGMTHEQAASPAVLKVNGRSLAVFNFGEGEFAQAQENGPGAARLDPFWSEQRVRQARGQFDIILVVLHIGNEYQPIPSPVTVSFCRRMAEAGADAVIAHHAHIPQCTEYWGDVPICFCLGNFLFGYEWDAHTFEEAPSWHLATVAELDFGGGRPQIRIHPLRQVRDLSLQPLSAKGRRAFDAYTRACEAILTDPDRHRRFWEQEARELFRPLMKRLPQLTADLAAPDRCPDSRAPAILYNLLNCDAHRETLQRGLRMIYEGRLADDGDAAAALADLRTLIRRCFED